MKHILIPTDFSEYSWNALKYSISFFKEIETTFYLLHVSPLLIDDEDLIDNPNASSESENLIQEKLNTLIKKTEEFSSTGKHHFEALHDHLQFVNSIRNQVTNNGIDMIVMGTKGNNEFNKTKLGSYTEDVITRVKCNALIIPEKTKFKKLKEIVFPTDFNILFKNNVLKTISDILENYKSTLNVLNISKKEKSLTSLQKINKECLEDSLIGNQLKFHYVANSNIENALQLFIENRAVDLVTIVAKNLNFSQRILFRPKVARISYLTEIPFLILHE